MVNDRLDTLSDDEMYRLSRVHELLATAERSLDEIRREAKESIVTDYSIAATEYANAVENARQAAIDLNTLSQYHLELAREDARKQINADLNRAVGSVMESGIEPYLNDIERIYYDILPPGQAFIASADASKLVANGSRTIQDLIVEAGPIVEPPVVEQTTNPGPFTGVGINTGQPTVEAGGGPEIINPGPIRPGERTCYLHLFDNKGKFSADIPLVISADRDCPPGYDDEPYRETVEPPDGPPTANCYAPPPNVTGYYATYIFAGEGNGIETWSVHYVRSPGPPAPGAFVGSFQQLVEFARERGHTICLAAYVSPDPIDAPPPPPPPPVITQQPSCTFWPTSDKSPIDNKGSGDEIICPPGCISIEKVISTNKTSGSNTVCIDFDNPSKVCQILTIGGPNDNTTIGKSDTGKAIDGTIDDIMNFIGSTFLSTLGGAPAQIPTLLSPLFGFSGDNIIIEAIKYVMGSGFGAMPETVKVALEGCCENWTKIAGLVGSCGLGGWISLLTQAPVDYLFQNPKYQLQAECPQYIPGQADLDNMYLGNYIGHEAWTCYTRCQGNLTNLHGMVLDGKRTRPGPRELLLLKRYRKLDEAAYDKSMRELGYIREEDKKRFEDSQVALPGISDIIRFMVRDAADDKDTPDRISAVTKGDLDADFDKKYDGALKEWVEAQNVPIDAMKYSWRSHWEYPSNTALYQMVARLRPGRVSEDLQVTEQDAYDLLGINDFAPAWRKKILAVAKAVVTRTDVKRAYNIDAFDKATVIEYLQDENYSLADAENIFKIMEEEKILYKQSRAARFSSFTPKQISRLYAEGSMSEQQATETLLSMQLKNEDVQTIINSGKMQAEVNRKKKCIKQIHIGYRYGVYDRDQAYNRLMDQIVDDYTSKQLIEAWTCENRSTIKEIPASKNVQWYVRGIINEEQLFNRLLNLGYTEAGLSGYMQEAFQKRQEAENKRLKEQQREIERARKEAERLAKEQAKQEKERRERLLEASQANPLNSEASGSEP